MNQEEEKKIKKSMEKVEADLKRSLEENGLDLMTMIDFPKYRTLPISLQLALRLLEEEGAVLVRKYQIKTKK